MSEFQPLTQDAIENAFRVQQAWTNVGFLPSFAPWIGGKLCYIVPWESGNAVLQNYSLASPLMWIQSMKKNVNRYKTTEYANLGSFYSKGLLTFGRSRRSIAKEHGISSRTVTNWWRRLERIQAIVPLGIQKVDPEKEGGLHINAFAAGQWRWGLDHNRLEVFYADIVSGAYGPEAEQRVIDELTNPTTAPPGSYLPEDDLSTTEISLV